MNDWVRQDAASERTTLVASGGMTALDEQTKTETTRPLPTRSLAVVGLGGCWIAVALAETMLGELDALPSAAELAAGEGRVTAAGLLHVLGGVLLATGAVGIASRAWATVMGRVGLVVALALSAGLGGFGMFHLIALELPDAQLRTFDGFGAWGVPIMVVLIGMTLGLPLLVAGMARAGDAPWWAFGVVTAGALLHFFGGTGILEQVSHWMVALGLLGAALSYARR